MFAPLAPEFTFASFTFPRYIVAMTVKPLAARLAEWKQTHSLHPVTGGYYVAPRPNDTKGISFYFASDFAPALRMRYADEVAPRSIRHKGWFADEFQDTVIRGIVARLPHGRGFLAGWTMGESMASGLDCSTLYDDEVEAARAADDEAERVAEREREYQDANPFEDDDALALHEWDTHPNAPDECVKCGQGLYNGQHTYNDVPVPSEDDDSE